MVRARRTPLRNCDLQFACIGSRRRKGDDYEMLERVDAGKTWGSVPFDELFTLGIDADNDCGCAGTLRPADGRKGSAPLGRNYFLSNWEEDKNIYSNGLLHSNWVLRGYGQDHRSRSPGSDHMNGFGMWECKQRRACWALRWCCLMAKICVRDIMPFT